MLDGIDIVVTSPTGHTDLVVEVKLTRQLDEATAQVRAYMARIGAPVGLVVGRDRLRILRETYRDQPSIRVVGEFSLELARGLRTSEDPSEFEDHVQHWLETLARTGTAAEEPLLAALREHVLPVILDGTVRAAGPRVRVAP